MRARLAALLFFMLTAPALADEPAPPPTPPALVEAPGIEYPDSARASRQAGDVVLLLDIDEAGRVTASAVESGVSPSLDQAAREGALRFTFKPATRGGKAIKSRIRYRHTFTLPESPAPAAAPAKAPQAEAPAQPALPAQPTETASAPPAAEAAPEEIEVRGERQPREQSRQVLTREELQLAPGSSGDPLRALQNMPGIARPVFPANGLAVRGTSASGTRVFVDGAWLPVMYHFGGLSSVVPAELIERIDFYAGHHGARWGRGLGGVIDVRTRELSRDGRYHALGQVDVVDARAVVEGPLPLFDGWRFIAAARRSWLDAWLGPVLRSSGASVQTAPYYHDYQVFAETNPTPTSRLRIGAFGGADEMRYVLDKIVEDDPIVAGANAMGIGYGRVQVTYEGDLGRDTRAQAMLALGRNREQMTFGRVKVDNRIDLLLARGEVSHRVGEALTLRVGLDAQQAGARVNLRVPDLPRAGEVSTSSWSTRRWTTVTNDSEFGRPAAWLEAEVTPVKRLTVVAGARADVTTETETLDLSPRLAASYMLRDAYPRTLARASAGLFYQSAELIDLIPGMGSRDLLSQRAGMVTVGVEQQIAPGLDVSVEGYDKHLDRLVVRRPAADGGQALDNSGEGRAIGLEAMLRYRNEGVFAWASYSLSRAVRRDGPGAPERLFEYDQTHTLTLVGSARVGRGFTLGARFRYISGFPYTPCLGGLLDASSGSYSCIPGATNSERLPAFHQLDLRVDKTWSFATWKLTAYLDLQNAYNRANAEGFNYSFDKSKREVQPGLPILPVLGLRGEL